MLQINPKKFKHIQNKTIPTPLRPRFRNKSESNIYFLSKRKVDQKKRSVFIRRMKIIFSIILVGFGGYVLSN
jgi:hypothetical protein